MVVRFSLNCVGLPKDPISLILETQIFHFQIFPLTSVKSWISDERVYQSWIIDQNRRSQFRKVSENLLLVIQFTYQYHFINIMGFVRDEEFRKFFYSDLDHKQLKIHKPHGRNYKSSE